MVELVAAGLGITFLPRMIGEQRRHPSVRHVTLADPEMVWHIALIWRRGGDLSDAAKAWLALAREVAGKEQRRAVPVRDRDHDHRR